MTVLIVKNNSSCCKYSMRLVIRIAIQTLLLNFCSGSSSKDATFHELSDIKHTYCPPWTIPVNDSNPTMCQCGDNLNNVVKCDPSTHEVSVQTCHCMTDSEILNKTIVGHCIFNCWFLDHLYKNAYDNNRESLPCTFNGMHRTGQLCGNCEPGYAPPVYSYRLKCVKCGNRIKYNWLKYIAVAFLPLTVVFAAIMLFRINVVTAEMNSCILACQILTAPVQMRIMAINALDRETMRIFRFLTSPFLIWNLDIFRDGYDPFCLHPKMTTLQTFALDYAVAVYPLLLVVLTYVVVTLHTRFITVVRLCSPVNRVFAFVRRESNVNSSLVSAFATFMLFSYVKIASISFDILTPVALYDNRGTKVPKFYLYYDGTIEYFGKDHLPYAILAIVMFVVFNLFPLILLCLYPSRYFHKCLNRCGFHSHCMHMFVEIYLGYYKTEPYDCRYFAGLYLGYRIISLAIFSFTTSPLYYAIGGSLSLLITILIAIVRPYKKQRFVVLDIVIFGVLTFGGLHIPAFAFTELADSSNVYHHWYDFTLPFVILSPQIYGSVVLAYKILPVRLTRKLKDCCKCLRQRWNLETGAETHLTYQSINAANIYNELEQSPLLPAPAE